MNRRLSREVAPTWAELRAERDFLLARCERAGAWYADPKRWVGISSNALVAYVFGGAEPTEREFPRDPSDLAACYRTVARLPEHLRSRGEEILPRYRQAVLDRYPLDELDAILAEEGVWPKTTA